MKENGIKSENFIDRLKQNLGVGNNTREGDDDCFLGVLKRANKILHYLTCVIVFLIRVVKTPTQSFRFISIFIAPKPFSFINTTKQIKIENRLN